MSLHDWLPRYAGLQLFQRWRGVFRMIVANSNSAPDELLRWGLPVDRVIGCAVEEVDLTTFADHFLDAYQSIMQ